MAKGLGQIHTCNFDLNPIDANGEKFILDCAGVLSNQLNHMVRHGNYFKVVGIDAIVSDFDGARTAGGQITGELRYYAPTRGRCEAFKTAFRVVREGAKNQGINLRQNANYDFRVPITPLSNYENGSSFKNNATIDGTNAVALYDAGNAGRSLYDVYNTNIEPSQAGLTPTFTQGYGLPGTGGVGTDFVLNEGAIFDPSMSNVASTAMESIPFQLSFTPGSTDIVAQFNWRPDPALYLAVMTGQFELYIDEQDRDDSATDLRIEIAIHIAGWKSIMGSPDRKRRRSSRKKKNGGGKK